MKKFLMATVVLMVVAAIVLGVGPLRDTDQQQATPAAIDVEFFGQRLQQNPSDVTSATRLGIALRQQQRETGDIGDLYEAEIVLRQALEIVPEYPPAQLELANVLIDLHRFDEGLALADSSYQRDPNPAGTDDHLGQP